MPPDDAMAADASVAVDAFGGGSDDAGADAVVIVPITDAGVHPLGDSGPSTHDLAGDVWTGYVEAFTFPSGSDAVRIVFDSAPAGTTSTSGVVIFGEGTPPPPATDPNVGYPPGVRSLPVVLVEGMPYPFTDASVSASRIQLTADASVVYERWCELQYPVPLAPGATSYGCLPNAGGFTVDGQCGYVDPATDTMHYVDCGRARLCAIGGPCVCDASECHAHASSIGTFDFHVVGSDGAGTMDGHTVYLTRS